MSNINLLKMIYNCSFYIIGYNFHDKTSCTGDYLDIHEETLEAAISACNAAGDCGCFDIVNITNTDSTYHLKKGTGILNVRILTMIMHG